MIKNMPVSLNKYKIRRAIIQQKWFLTLIVTLGIVGCASTKGDWEKAQKHNTIVAYEEFIQKNSKSEFSTEAKRRIHDLEWQKAKRMDTIEVYKEFINKYPRSEFNNEATARIERFAWEKTNKLNTIEAYQEFLRAYPYSVLITTHTFDRLGITVQELNENIANNLGYNDFQKNVGVLVLMTDSTDFVQSFFESVELKPKKGLSALLPGKAGLKEGDIIVSVDGEKRSKFDDWMVMLKEKETKWEKFTIWRKQTYFTVINKGRRIWTVTGYDIDVKDFEERLLKENSKINSKIGNISDALRLKGKPDHKGYSDSSWGPLETWVYEEECMGSLIGRGGYYYFYFNKDGTLKATRCDFRLTIISH